MNKVSISIQKCIKRAMDFFIAFFIIVLFLPFWLAVALLIKIDSKGPVFFIQERPGYKTKVIKVYKFRTMRLGSENMVKGKEVMGDDDRITRIGGLLRRYKIDEVPQLLNILRGEMSLIGPRPERLEYLEEYTDVELSRFEMLPGITGLAQVSGNIYISLEDRHKFDIYYVQNFSLWLDVKIIIRTVGVILLGEEKFVNLGTKGIRLLGRSRKNHSNREQKETISL